MKLKVSRAKERENARQRKYFNDDIIQPWDDKGRRSREFEKRYGNKIYGNNS